MTCGIKCNNMDLNIPQETFEEEYCAKECFVGKF